MRLTQYTSLPPLKRNGIICSQHLMVMNYFMRMEMKMHTVNNCAILKSTTTSTIRGIYVIIYLLSLNVNVIECARIHKLNIEIDWMGRSELFWFQMNHEFIDCHFCMLIASSWNRYSVEMWIKAPKIAIECDCVRFCTRPKMQHITNN